MTDSTYMSPDPDLTGCHQQDAQPKSASSDIYRLEQVLESAIKLAEIARSSVGRTLSDGPSHPSLALMDLSVRALRQANDAARWSRHALRIPPSVLND